MTVPLLAHAGHSHDRPSVDSSSVEPAPSETETPEPSPSPMMVHQEIPSEMDSVTILHPVLNVGTLMVFALVATPIVLITAKNKWYS